MAESGGNQIEKLTAMRHLLLRLHKVLLDAQRERYEREHGPVGSAGQFLQLAIHDPDFHWLHGFSTLIVQIDEAIDGDEPVTSTAADMMIEQVRKLVGDDSVDFHQTIAADQASANVFRELEPLLSN